MVSLTIKKKKGIKFLNEKISEGNNILNRISNIQNQSDYQLMIDEHELWWNSTGELLKQIFDDERIANNFKNVGIVGVINQTLIQKIRDFKNDVQNDIIKIQQVISNIKNNVYVSVNKFEFTYDGIISALKRNKIIAIVLLLIVIFLGVAGIIDSYVKTRKNIGEIKSEFSDIDTSEVNSSDSVVFSTRSNVTNQNNAEIILLDSIKLPYLENLTILDKGLYIRYDFNNIDFGGVNIDTISINARARDGKTISINKDSNVLKIDLTREPYIEFEYKGENYSIETFGKHYSFYCTLRKNVKLTMKLNEYKKLK